LFIGVLVSFPEENWDQMIVPDWHLSEMNIHPFQAPSRIKRPNKSPRRALFNLPAGFFS
jgi:hypothetical protein